MRDNYAAILAAESADPQPSYAVDGRHWSWNEWRDSLMKQIDDLNTLIIKTQGASEISTIALG